MKAAVITILSFCLVSPVLADAGLFGTAYETLAVNPASSMVTVHSVTGWQTSPAISWSDSWSTSGYQNATLTGSMYYTSDYGYLTTGAAGDVHSSPGTGAFASSNPYNSDYNAAFKDLITADQDLTLSFDLHIEDQSTLHYDVTGQNFTKLNASLNAGGVGGQETYSGSGTYDITGTLSMSAGSQAQVLAWLGMSCEASANVQATASASFTLDSTARLYINDLTPGTTFHTQSGHIYQSVPEPSELVFGAVSFLGLALSKRRGRKQ